MFDVFYLGIKPNLFPHERKADSVEHARELSSTRYCWVVDYLTDYSTFDFLWEPAPWQGQYTHVWPSRWAEYYSTYLVPKYADKIEYHVHDVVLQPRVIKENFKFLDNADFDTTWCPHPWEPPYIYVFGNQHYPGQIMPTVEYHMPGATERKFVDDVIATLQPSALHWETLEPIDETKWDWTWRPNPKDPPYIYVWGNQWNTAEFKASIRYHVPGATEYKYMDQRTVRLPQKHLFEVKIAVGKFDYSWEPNPYDPPYIYVFGNTWYPAEIEPSVTYTVPGATEIKYVHDIVATPWGSMADWDFLDDIVLESFDWTWHPNPKDPPYIYMFGSNWHSAEVKPVLCYAVDGASEVKYMDAPRAQRTPQPHLFTKLHACEIDASWEPDPGSPPYIYVFGNQWHAAEIMPTVEYRMPGATQIKYVDHPRAVLAERHDNHWHTIIDCNWDYSWVPDPGDPPYIYVFGNQHWPAEKMPTVEYHVPGATERKYMDYPRAELLADTAHWSVPAGIDLATVDFTWRPDPGEPPYIYQFATQHQKTGGPVYTVPGATEVKYLEQVQVKIEFTTVPVVEIDHLDGNAGQVPNTIKRIRYFDNYRDTLIRLAKSLVGQYEWVWVCSSICDYTGFDFSWHPEKWQSTMLHVFASNDQKFGDTFYMHVPTFAERAEKKALLEWYSVNYVPRKSVPRRPMPVIEHSNDTHVDVVKNTDWAGPLALFTVNGMPITVPTVPLWREETKTIVPLSAGASTVIIPKTAKGSVKAQLYDYAHIDKTQRKRHSDQRLDIVFISNGEPNAEHNWNYMRTNCRLSNRIHRIDGVNGRVLAYHAAAQASRTPWFFAVFAKLEVNPNFDFGWQPDRMQQPKHYIFHAENPVNGLEYGHQAMIAYNRELVLSNTGVGLDFTLDSAHEVVPINSGIAYYDYTPWMTWRTAFREVLKLRASMPDVESEYRLKAWLTNDVSPGQWSMKGAEDAVSYYEEVQGDFAALKKSYEWNWLASYAFIKRGLAPDQ